MIESISGIVGIVFMIFFITYIKVNNKIWDETKGFMETQLELNKKLIKRLDKFEKQQQKDRSDIADYLNEQLKNK
jgi:hypothetical protein